MPSISRVHENRDLVDDVRLPVSIRAYAPGYAASSLLLIFFAVLSVYLSYNPIAGTMIVLAILVPVLALTDRVVFDGKRLIRTGILPRLWFRLNGLRGRVKLRNVEQVDTVTVGSFRRGGRVRFMHRTSIFGNGPPIVFSGAGKRYRRMIRALLPKLESHLLDCKSLDFQKYLVEPHQVNRLAAALKIPPADVLEGSVRERPTRSKNGVNDQSSSPSVDTDQLILSANQLRVSGSLIRAMEAFRRALRIEPRDPWLLFEYSRCLFALSKVDKDARLGRRGAAALRLAEMRAFGDAELLERIGESYRQFGFSRRAANAYQAALERLGEGFRALIGLAELALDQGKLAHVVHNFSAANMATRNAALKRWTRSEADYFSRLSDDDNYMELEVSRMNLLDKLARWRGAAFRIAVYSIPLIAAGIIFEEPLLTDAGWLVSTICFVGWAVMNIVFKMLTPRIPYDLVEGD